MKRVIVAGSRYFNDKDKLYSILDDVVKELGSDIEIVSGCCRGADKLGEQYAEEHNIPVKRFPADWAKYGLRAGYVRNAEMAEYASNGDGSGWLVAFPLEVSKGTKMMVDLARKNCLKICVVQGDLIYGEPSYR